MVALSSGEEMVHRDARTELATCLQRLVSGDMTNDEFDSRYDRWENTGDAAVAEIARFGWGLYSDSHPYRLKGGYAVSEDDRQLADRAVLFLQSDLEYEWPTKVAGIVPFWCLWGPGCYLVFGVVLLSIAGLVGGSDTIVFGLLGLLATVPALHWLVTHRKRAKELKRFHEGGDLNAWPFLQRADLVFARTIFFPAESQRRE